MYVCSVLPGMPTRSCRDILQGQRQLLIDTFIIDGAMVPLEQPCVFESPAIVAPVGTTQAFNAKRPIEAPHMLLILVYSSVSFV